MGLPDDVRSACARVVAAARFVRIDEPAIEEYARALPAVTPPSGPPPRDQEAAAAHSLTLNAINFGSGWFPTLRKPGGLSGFRTVEAGLRANGPWPAGELAEMRADTVAAALGQDPGHELMALYAAALRELGAHVRHEHGGSFVALARSGEGSAVALAERLATWPGWRDPGFFKRAQIAAADLHREGIAPAADIGRLTAFADNLVPHVLRVDGVLQVDPTLAGRIDSGELLVHGSPEEVELRAAAVHAVELMVAARGDVTAAAVDEALWTRGGQPRYKAVPRHRSRTTAY